MFGLGPACLEPHAGAIIRKKEKEKIRGGGVICAPSAKKGIAPDVLNICPIRKKKSEPRNFTFSLYHWHFS